MQTITKCLNEWNATIEAMGHAKQSILIRNYKTALEEFLLYPTTSYLINENYLNSFKNEYKSFVKENSYPNKDANKYEVKYYAKVEKIIETSSHQIGRFNNYHIWTNSHVKSYLNSKKAYIWLLRVFQLQNPIMTSRTKGMVFANTKKPISIDNMKPVLSDSEFNKIKNGF